MVTVAYTASGIIDEYGDLVGDTIVVSEGRIAAVTHGAYPSYATRRRVDGYLLPAFIDAHMHIAGLGLSLEGVDLRGARDPWEVAEALAGSRGPIAYGRGWDQEAFQTEKRYPTRRELDAAVPDRPAVAVRVCGHVATANTAALEAARPWERYPHLVDRERGILLEDAVEYTIERLLENTDITGMVAVALEALASAGIGGVSSLSCTPAEARALRRLEASGALRVRVACYPKPERLVEVQAVGRGRMWATVGVKVFADGSLGARTAFLREPYSDDPGNRGMRLLDARRVAELARFAAERRLRLAVHAIGDAALDEVLEGFEASGVDCHAHCRVEHASVAWREQVERLSALRAYAVVQPHFRVSDWWVEERLGARRMEAVYPLRTMASAGVKLAFSSDAPVEPYQPWHTFAAALARCSQPACREEEALTPEEAIEAYTTRAAEASGGPVAALGSLRRGAPAVLALTPGDPRSRDWSGPLRLLYHGV